MTQNIKQRWDKVLDSLLLAFREPERSVLFYLKIATKAFILNKICAL